MNNAFKTLKGIFFDLDDTLYSYDEANEKAIASAVDFLGAKLRRPIEEVRRAFFRGREKVHEVLRGQAASHSRLLYIQKCIEELAGKTDVSLALAAHEVFLETFFGAMALREGAREFFLWAREKGFRIVIVTDLTADIQLKKIARLGIKEYIDYVATSEEAGAEKPDPRIFALALQKTDMRPEEVVMIGDHYEKDIEGAKKAGIPAIYFPAKEPHSAPGVLRAATFEELKTLLCN